MLSSGECITVFDIAWDEVLAFQRYEVLRGKYMSDYESQFKGWYPVGL